MKFKYVFIYYQLIYKNFITEGEAIKNKGLLLPSKV